MFQLNRRGKKSFVNYRSNMLHRFEQHISEKIIINSFSLSENNVNLCSLDRCHKYNTQNNEQYYG